MNDGGPAFPKPCDECSHSVGEHACYGMSLRDYACIRLKVPETDKDWLNVIILKALRTDLAGMALAAMTAAPDYSKGPCNSAMAERAYVIAEWMLAERDKVEKRNDEKGTQGIEQVAKEPRAPR